MRAKSMHQGSGKSITEADQRSKVYKFPASFPQRRMWFLNQLEPDSPYYNIPSAFRITGRLDPELFRLAVEEVVKHQEALRTTFTQENGMPVQVIWPCITVESAFVDFSTCGKTGLSESEDKEIREIMRNEARTPFDLQKGPLFRLKIIRISETDHIILFTMHHIISDGWSVGILIRETAAVYSALSLGETSPLRPLPLQYIDYTSWQSKQLSGEALKKQMHYWKNRFSSLPPVLELPADSLRPSEIKNLGGIASRSLGSELGNAVRKFSLQNGLTPFMTLIGAFYILLFRYTGQQDICIGTPVANRRRRELEDIIGLFINTLVLREQIGAEETALGFFRRVKTSALEAFENQDIPLELLLQELQPDRTLNHTPLFQVMFILQNLPAEFSVSGDLKMRMLATDLGTSAYDLSFILSEAPEGIEILAEYNSELFSAERIEYMLRHYENILTDVLSCPEKTVQRLNMLGEDEKQRLLSINDKAGRMPDYRSTVPQLFEITALQNPGAAALLVPEEGESGEMKAYSYGYINSASNKLANYLRSRNIGKEKTVAILLGRSAEMIISMLGVLKSGAAFLPIDIRYPASRIKYMLKDSQASLIITQTGLLDTKHFSDFRLLMLDEHYADIDVAEDFYPLQSPETNTIAYIIYTSGSTGIPKGVEISHFSIANYSLSAIRNFGIDSSDRVLQFSSISFDTSLEEIFPCLLAGGTLVLRTDYAASTAEEFFGFCSRAGITVLDLPTAYWQMLVTELEEKGSSLLPSSLRLVILGGDKAESEKVNSWLRTAGRGIRLFNTYGPTETTIAPLLFEITASSAGRLSGEIPIGHPADNLRVYVADEHLNLLPAGVTGEIYIAGAGVARGYLNNPDLTALSFIPDPFTSIPGSRMYRTGDLGRYSADGEILFVGRKDSQVKIRGFRVETAEVETALLRNKSIKNAAVTVHKDRKGLNFLAAYIVTSDDMPQEAVYVRKSLSEELPAYMIPSAVIFLKELPLTLQGKIDKNRLPAPGEYNSENIVSEDTTPPKGHLEEMISEIWSEVLNISGPGVMNDFFLLGGHSLLAVQVISRINEVFNISVPLKTIFENTTIRALARSVSQIIDRDKTGFEQIRPAGRNAALPLSFAQQRLWFLDQFEPDSPFYNISDAFRLRGPLNIPLLEECLNFLIDRHEVLRTSVLTRDGKPSLQIHQNVFISIPVVDLSFMSAENRDSESFNIIRNEAHRVILLNTAPLFRIKIVKLDDEEHIISLTIHHIISDDWSVKILLNEIISVYAAKADGKEISLKQQPVQYADYAVWQRGWLEGPAMQLLSNYWEEKLKNMDPDPVLNNGRPRPAVQIFSGSFLTFEISKDTADAIRTVNQRFRATTFMTLLSAFGALLYRYSRRTDIPIGTPAANRNHQLTEEMIGLFVNTLVLRLDISGTPSFRQLLGRVRQTSLEAYTYQDMPFEKLVDILEPERSLSRSPLFQVMFVFQNTPVRRVRVSSSLSLTPIEVHSGTSKFDLTLFISEDAGGGLSCAFEYNTTLFSSGYISAMAEHFLILLNQLLTHTDKPIDELEMIDSQEKNRLLDIFRGGNLQTELGDSETAKALPAAEWADEGRNGPIDEDFVHKGFELAASEFPDSHAIIYYGPGGNQKSISFRELNEKANRLSHLLLEKGLGPDKTAGLALKRSPELIVSLLAVLKTGAAYLPVDAGYPSERLSWMISDADTCLIITDSSLSERLCEFVSYDKLVIQDGLNAELDSYPSENPDAALYSDALAYIIYTSGSTGRPKGVMISHRALSSYVRYALRAYDVSKGTGTLLHLSLSFDAAVTSIFPSILCGKPVILIPELDGGLSPLADAFRRHKGLSHIKITPAHLEALSMELKEYDDLRGLCNSFVVGGEDMKARLLNSWKMKTPGTLVFNEYGPTEATVGCIVYEASMHEETSGSVPIGRVIPGMRAYILDEKLKLQAFGLAGELYLAGRALSRGYLNRPELTAERFIPDPFSTTPGERLYRTGDLVRLLEDGNMIFVGRNDQQIKVRGYRIEPGEIEDALKSCLPITDAAVVLCTNQQKAAGTQTDAASDRPVGTENMTSLAAFYTTEDNQPLEASLIRSSLGSLIPEYMVPSLFVHLESMPLTVNGKTDRRALHLPEVLSDSTPQNGSQPETPEEELLLSIWQELLPVRQIGVNDNFFEIGGDSILSIQIVSRANSMGLSITPKDIFEYPTVRQLALSARTHRSDESGDSTQLTVEGMIPLTPIQHWFFEQHFAQFNHWNQSVLLELEHPMNTAKLEDVFRILLRQHDALRIRFEHIDGRWLQYNEDVDLESNNVLEVIDLSDADTTGVQEVICRESERVQASLDIRSARMIKAVYFNTGDASPHRLLIVIHHLVTDGLSWGILLNDMLYYYKYEGPLQNGFLRKTSSFLLWAETLKKSAGSEKVIAAYDYWRRIIEEGNTQIPARYTASDAFESTTDSVAASLPAEYTDRLLRDSSLLFSAQPLEVILSAVAQVLLRWSRNEKMLICIESHGREQISNDLNLSRTVGWFTNIYPVLVRRTTKGRFSDAVSSVKEQLSGLEGRGIEYGLLRYLSEEGSGVNRNSLSFSQQVLFNYWGQSVESVLKTLPFKPARENRGPERGGGNQVPYLLEITAGISEGQLQFEWSFSTSRFERKLIDRLSKKVISKLKYIFSSSDDTAPLTGTRKVSAAPDTGGDDSLGLGDFGLDRNDLESILSAINKPED